MSLFSILICSSLSHVILFDAKHRKKNYLKKRQVLWSKDLSSTGMFTVISRCRHTIKINFFFFSAHSLAEIIALLSVIDLIEPMRWFIHSTSYLQWATKETKWFILIVWWQRDNTVIGSTSGTTFGLNYFVCMGWNQKQKLQINTRLMFNYENLQNTATDELTIKWYDLCFT